MSALASAAAAFEADEFSKLPHDEQLRKLRFDLRRLQNQCADDASVIRKLCQRVSRLEGLKASRA